MKTTVEIDDAVLRAAEDKARKLGKPLGVFIEEALRVTILAPAIGAPAPSGGSSDDGLDDNDPFFAALEEVRATGRAPAPHRKVRFQ